MAIRISNSSAAAWVRGYVRTEDGMIVWLEMAPQHPKVIGAIWAEMVANQRRYLQLGDHEKGVSRPVYGIAHAYERLEAEAPGLAVGHGANAKLLRLIAPEAIPNRVRDVSGKFFVLEWPNPKVPAQMITPAIILAATLEQKAAFPVQIGWGEYLLSMAQEKKYASPLVSGGKAPAGYEISLNTPWCDFICNGLRDGHITIDGETKVMPATLPIHLPVAAA